MLGTFHILRRSLKALFYKSALPYRFLRASPSQQVSHNLTILVTRLQSNAWHNSASKVLPLFTELPRGVLLGNLASSIPHSRQPTTRKSQGFYTPALVLKPRLASSLLLLAGVTASTCVITGSRSGLVDPLLAPRLVVAVGGDIGAHSLKVELGSPRPLLGE